MKKLRGWLFRTSQPLFYGLLRIRTIFTLPATKRAVRRYLETASEPKLQLGSGRNYLDGWLNTDYLAKPPAYPYLNARKPFPFPDNQFVRVYSEHMIEHIDQKAGENMIRECFRVLKPGCRVRIETPDLEKFCNFYRDKQDPDVMHYVKWHAQNVGLEGFPANTCFAINNAVRNWGHLFIYDEETLRFVMEKAGFVNLKRYSWGESDDEKFKGVSQRSSYPFSLFETFVLEGEKPAN